VVSLLIGFALAGRFFPSGSGVASTFGLSGSVAKALRLLAPDPRPTETPLWRPTRLDRSADAPLGTRDYDDIRSAMLEAINADRVAHGLEKVRFDRVLCDLGDEHCWEMVRGWFASHWTTDGLKPYQRYSLPGGSGFHAQNVAWRRESVGLDHGDSAKQAALLCYRAMMAETPPKDGHRQTILTPEAERVGIGIAVEGEHFAMTHEFAGQRVCFVDPQVRRAQPKATLPVTVSIADGRELDAVVVLREPPPKAMTSAQLSATEDYGVGGEEVRELRPTLGPGWQYKDGSRGELTRRGGGLYSGKLTLPSIPGLYNLAAVVDGKVTAVITIASPPEIVRTPRFRWPSPHVAGE
jgi:uncharacterized protein YkwD